MTINGFVGNSTLRKPCYPSSRRCGEHLSDDTLESFCLGLLSSDVSRSTRAHIARCRECARRVCAELEFIDLLRAALGRFREYGSA